MNFLAGFVGAGIVGLIGTILAQALANIEAANKRMSSPPKPALRATEEENIKGIGTDPDQSPIQVLNAGCWTIVGNLLLVAIIFISIALIFTSIPEDALQQEIPEETLVGIFYAALLGALIRAILWNWGEIVNLYRRMINPPEPTLQSTEPPNSHHVAAKPPLSPQQVVVDGCFGIVVGMILQILLVGALLFSVGYMFRYLFR